MDNIIIFQLLFASLFINQRNLPLFLSSLAPLEAHELNFRCVCPDGWISWRRTFPGERGSWGSCGSRPEVEVGWGWAHLHTVHAAGNEAARPESWAVHHSYVWDKLWTSRGNASVSGSCQHQCWVSQPTKEAHDPPDEPGHAGGLRLDCCKYYYECSGMVLQYW